MLKHRTKIIGVSILLFLCGIQIASAYEYPKYTEDVWTTTTSASTSIIIASTTNPGIYIWDYTIINSATAVSGRLRCGNSEILAWHTLATAVSNHTKHYCASDNAVVGVQAGAGTAQFGIIYSTGTPQYIGDTATNEVANILIYFLPAFLILLVFWTFLGIIVLI